MVYCFDLDGTLCTNTDGDYANAKPFVERILKVNSLYDAGHEVFIYTARGARTGIDWHDFTKKQLQRWGVKYTLLRTDKPHYDVIVDDKAIDSEDYFAL